VSLSLASEADVVIMESGYNAELMTTGKGFNYDYWGTASPVELYLSK